MAIQLFPPVWAADEHGLLAVGGDLEPSSLLLAYKSGIFPWPLVGKELLWFAPPQRALLFLDSFHTPRRLKRTLRQNPAEIRVNTCFPEVISACATSTNRRNIQGRTEAGTWITEQMIEGYIRLHEAGYCHSIECFRDGRLIGGLYGVAIAGMFAGESMFYREPEASKRCLCFLVDYLRQRGVPWIDCQQITPLLAQFGAVEVSREEFMGLLGEVLSRDVVLFTRGV